MLENIEKQPKQILEKKKKENQGEHCSHPREGLEVLTALSDTSTSPQAPALGHKGAGIRVSIISGK